MSESPGDRLRSLRISKGYKKPEDAAEAFGWNKHTYKAHEQNARGIKPETAKMYAKAYGTAPEYIYFGGGGQNPPNERSSTTKPLADTPSLQSVTQPLHFGPVVESSELMPVYGPGGASSTERVPIVEDNIVDWLPKPDYLAKIKGSYWMYVRGDSMEPAYNSKWLVAVHPRLPPNKGDDCVIFFNDGTALIKQFIDETTDSYKFKQYNPPKTLAFKKTEIQSLQMIMGKRKR